MTTRSGNKRAVTSSSKLKKNPGMDQLQEWVELARYEINVDPYRGLQEILDGASTVKSPWRLSCVPDLANNCNTITSSTPSENSQDGKEATILEAKGDDAPFKKQAFDAMDTSDDDDDELSSIFGNKNDDTSDDDQETALVASVARCKCPALMHWTCEAAKKNQRKRKKQGNESHIGVARRPMDSLDYRCACDYNPFCLLSLGGVLEEVLIQTHGEEDSSDEVEVISDWDDPKADVYSNTTREFYKRVRRSATWNVESIRDYLDEMVEDVDGVIDLLLARQSFLYFNNPLAKPGPLMGNKRLAKIPLALPPGIENLGATCYLNTQLQCLAQNRVFLQGILRWECDADDRMSNVLRLFQNLLARMHFGPFNTVNTLDFSNALGLDHHEQQDPNEFSRLFLERMHESFQGSDLGDLLPTVFRGEITFETVCRNCNFKSARKEHFMDLNLPILERKRRGIGCSVLELMNPKQKSVDLNDCLTAYGLPEHLDGDNQYYCTQCESKQDAVRHHILSRLPSVLNLQLVRYIYNRETSMKKKVTTAVSIPQYLNVGKDKYRLCAIMSHKGASAYSGHYTAEAMDWSSGQWYSFNDEKVHPLPKGPSSCYCNAKEFEGCEGSSDAYNLYYVSETFLTQSVLDGIREPLDNLHTARTVTIERCNFFQELSEMCIKDAKAVEHLKRRRETIKNQLLSREVGSWLWSLAEKDMVWIDTGFLINFFSCLDRTHNVMNLSEFFTDSPPWCEHKKLHPRVARKGKFLPRAMADLIVECLQMEQRYSTKDGSEQGPSSNGASIIHGGDVVCKECSISYTDILAKKLTRVERMLKLRTALEPSGLSSAFPLTSEDHVRNTEEEFAFVLSRKFATWFRNTVDDFAKSSLKDASCAQRVVCDLPLVICKAENSAEGLDGLDPVQFMNPSSGDENVVQKVNGPIVCKHDHFKRVRKQSYFVVPVTLWIQIKALFPDGIEIKFKNNPSQDESECIDSPFCLKCFDEPDSAEVESSSIGERAKPKTCAKKAAVIMDDNDVIFVEAPPTIFDLRVFEANFGSDIDEILDALTIVHGNDQAREHGVDTNNTVYPRRSSRKRKMRYPMGCLVDEDTCRIDFLQNIASLRLSLLEKCANGSTFQLDHKLHLVIIKRPKQLSGDVEPFSKRGAIVESLSYARNTDSLKAVCEGAASEGFSEAFDPSSSLILIRVAEREPTILPDIGKDEIFDHFILLAHGANGNKQENNRPRRIERGFNGTFLMTSEINGGRQHEDLKNEAKNEDPKNETKNGDKKNETKSDDPKNETKSDYPPEETNTSNVDASGRSEVVSHALVSFTPRATVNPDGTASRTNKTTRDTAKLINDEIPGFTFDEGDSVVQDDHSNVPASSTQVNRSNDQKSARSGTEAHKESCLRDRSKINRTIKRANDDTAGAARLLDSVIKALELNPDICDDNQNHPMIRLAAEQVRITGALSKLL